jgi:hypothetical protein
LSKSLFGPGILVHKVPGALYVIWLVDCTVVLQLIQCAVKYLKGTAAHHNNKFIFSGKEQCNHA